MYKNNRLIRIFSLILLLVMLVSTGVRAEMTAGEKFEEIKAFIRENYPFDITDDELNKAALEYILRNHPELWHDAMIGAMEALDDYSYYLTPEEYDAWMNNISGTYAGIGVAIEQAGEYVAVVQVYENTPAKKAGIAPGDIFLEIDGVNVQGYNIEQLRGLVSGEAGTLIKIKFSRKDVGELVFEFARETIDAITVESRIIEEKGVGYIKILQFSTVTPMQVKTALDSFQEAGINNLLLDIRDNPGGERDSVIEVASFFLPKGPVTHLQFKDPEQKRTFFSENENPYQFNTVLLINENSASASELLAGAMKDTKTATLVGRNTFGKGTVQTIVRLIVGGGIKMTIATYATPLGNEVNKVGIAPDHTVNNLYYAIEDHPEHGPFLFETEISESSENKAITIAQNRLKITGFMNGEVNGVYDEETKDAVIKFQASQGYEATGRLDIYTQICLDNISRDKIVTHDLQMEKALELFN